MRKPVSYIAEAPTFSTGEIAIALLILAAVVAAFITVLVVGIKGFHRLGLGRRDSLPVRLAPLVAAFDVLFFMSVARESVFWALVPAATHLGAFLLGYNDRDEQPEPPPPTGV